MRMILATSRSGFNAGAYKSLHIAMIGLESLARVLPVLQRIDDGPHRASIASGVM